jgi:hypothetical protein
METLACKKMQHRNRCSDVQIFAAGLKYSPGPVVARLRFVCKVKCEALWGQLFHSADAFKGLLHYFCGMFYDSDSTYII